MTGLRHNVAHSSWILTRVNKHWVYFSLVVFSLAVICFLPSVWGEFVFDDAEAILNNDDVISTTPVSEVFKHDFWGAPIISKRSHKSFRPLTVLTFKLNYWLAGGYKPMIFHATNIILHGIVTLIFMFVCSTVMHSTHNVDGCGHIIKQDRITETAVIAAVLFAVHPIHTECVAGIVGRAELCAGLCFFMAFWFYMKSHNSDVTNGLTCAKSFLNVMITVILSASSMLFKEQGITVLGICCGYDLMIKRTVIKDNNVWMVRAWNVCRIMILLVSTGFLVWWRFAIMLTGAPSFQRMDNPASFAENMTTRILSYNYIYALNGWLLLNPWWLCFDWSMGCVPLLERVTDPRVAVVVIFWLTLGSLVLYTVSGHYSPQKRLVAYCLLLMILPFLPSSNLLFRVGFVVAERVLYLPSAGYCLLLSVGYTQLSHYCNKHYKHIPHHWIGIFVLMLYVIMSMKRSCEWTTENSLYTSGAKVCPLNAKVHYNIGKIKVDQGNTEEGEQAYREAIRLYPEYDQALNNLGNLLKETGRPSEAEIMFHRALNSSPEMAAAWMNLGIVQVQLKKYESAEQSYFTAIKHRKKYPDAYYNLGNLYIDQGFPEKAISSFRHAIHLKSDHARSWSNLGLLFENLNKLAEAEKLFRDALKVFPHDSEFHFKYGVVLGKLRKYEEGQRELLSAIELNPNNADYYGNLGVIYHLVKDFKKAVYYYEQALQIDPNQSNTRDNLKKLKRTLSSTH